MFYTFLNNWNIKIRIIFHDTCKWHDIQISVSKNKVLLEHSPSHSLFSAVSCLLQQFLYYGDRASRNCGRNQMAVNLKYFTLYLAFLRKYLLTYKRSTLGSKVSENYCNPKWGSSCSHSEANKESRLVERKVCFCSWGWQPRGEGRVESPRPEANCPTLPSPISGQELYREWRGPHAETAQSSWQSSLNWSYGGNWSALSWLF